MSVTTALLAFMAASAVVIVAPGPDTALVLRTTAVEGPRRVIALALSSSRRIERRLPRLGRSEAAKKAKSPDIFDVE